MMQTVLNTVRVAGATSRLTRFVTRDDLGKWWIREPLEKTMERHANHRLARYTTIVDCPWCVSFHAGWLMLLGETLTIWAPPIVRSWWEIMTGALALSEITTATSLYFGLYDGTDD